MFFEKMFGWSWDQSFALVKGENFQTLIFSVYLSHMYIYTVLIHGTC